MSTNSNFFITEFDNMDLYWITRLNKHIADESASISENQAVLIEIFVSTKIDNRSNISKEFSIPYNEIHFTSPEDPIVDRIAKHYGFSRAFSLRRVAEGFYRFYRLTSFWNAFWPDYYENLTPKDAEKYIKLCVLTFLSLSYPGSTKRYLRSSSPGHYALSNERAKFLGFSSIASLVKCSVEFCFPHTKLPFPWDPRDLNNEELFWNKFTLLNTAEEFSSVVNRYINNEYSMLHDDYEIFEYVLNDTFSLSFKWEIEHSDIATADQTEINQILEKTAKRFSKLREARELSVESRSEISNSTLLQVLNTFLRITNNLSDIITVDTEHSDSIQSLLSNTDFVNENILTNQSLLEDFHDNLVTISTAVIELNAQMKSSEKQSAMTSRSEPHALSYPSPTQKETLKILREQYSKQSAMLHDTLNQNKVLKEDLQNSVSAETLRTVLAKFFKPVALEKILAHMIGK